MNINKSLMLKRIPTRLVYSEFEAPFTLMGKSKVHFTAFFCQAGIGKPRLQYFWEWRR